MIEQEVDSRASNQDATERRPWAIAATSMFFILLQSACSAFVALSGVQLLIGVGSLAFAATAARFLVSIHGPAIRLPMEFLALAGSFVNLYGIWRARSLRARPSSQWRMSPVTPKKKRAETLQIALAVLTLLLVGIEWALHISLHHSI